MKISVPQGETLENALAYLDGYLSQYKDTYGVLRGRLNLYISLESEDHTLCPDEECNIELTGEGAYDLDESKFDAVKFVVLQRWKRYVNAVRSRPDLLQAKVYRVQKILDASGGLDLSEEVVQKRQEDVEEAIQCLEEALKERELVNTLEQRIKDNEFRWILQRLGEEGDYKEFYPAAYLFFEDKDRGTYYYPGPTSRLTPGRPPEQG